MFYLAVRNITRRLGSSLVTVFIVALAMFVTVAGTSAFLSLSQGVQKASDRLGADIIVLPKELGADPSEALFTAQPANIYLPEHAMSVIAGIEGIEAMSPQFFTQTLNQSCCTVMGVTRVVGIDPATDFTIRPWIGEEGLASLAPDEIILGANAPEVPGNVVSILGNQFRVVARLDVTGTSVDETIFMLLETARRIGAESPYLERVWRSTDPFTSISCILVKVADGYDPEDVALAISAAYPEASVTAVAGLVRNTSQQLNLFLKAFALLAVAIIVIVVLALAGRFSALAKDRRGELGFLRAQGAGKGRVMGSLLTETLLLCGAGGVIGAALGIPVAVSLANQFHNVLSLPYASLSAGGCVALFALGVVLAAVLSIASSIGTAYRYATMDPFTAMQRGEVQ
ncbi:MAG: ABC transporter permease [Eggerthellaceae bacterium]|nr:ABC transporter permease [Eggerthellaceae bacterium]